MTVTSSPGYGFPLATVGTDSWPSRAGWMAVLQSIEDKSVRFGSGAVGSRPATPALNLLWREPSGRVTFYTTSGWVELIPAGGAAAAGHTHTAAAIGAVPSGRQVVSGDGLTGGGPLTADLALALDYAGSGFSPKPARADHTHPYVPNTVRYNNTQNSDFNGNVNPNNAATVASMTFSAIPAGAVQVASSLYLHSAGNCAANVDMYIGGTFAGYARFHTNGRPLSGYFPVLGDLTKPTAGDVLVTLIATVDSNSDTPLEVRTITQHLTVV